MAITAMVAGGSYICADMAGVLIGGREGLMAGLGAAFLWLVTVYRIAPTLARWMTP